MANERLQGAMDAAGIGRSELAERVGVDPKTAERWITRERVPHWVHRIAVARAVGTDAEYLWPSTSDASKTVSASRAELVEFYPARSAIPPATWGALIDDATEAFDFLAYAGLFLPEQFDVVDRLVRRAKDGVRVRVLLGDPDGEAVGRRGEEEGLGAGSIAARANLSIGYFQRALAVPGLEVRTHDTTLYASIYRADADLLANVHPYGSPAGQSPVLHLRRVPGGRTFDAYLRSFEQVWATGKPVTAA